jgi:hydroxymethylpyrimidine pyrophosphatase-like HAD family hydrolase
VKTKAFLFDVDGVVTDPLEKKVLYPEILSSIIKILKNGGPVGLNTGRSTSWVTDRVLNPMLQLIDDLGILKNFIVIGEYGGTWIEFDSSGKKVVGENSDISIPKDLSAAVIELVKTEFSESMFFDDSKKTMISIEMADGFDLEKFSKLQQQLVVKLKNLLNDFKLQDQFKIDVTTIATDIESYSVGKGLGADQFLRFLQKRQLKPTNYLTFGDSIADFAMADRLHELGEKVEFIYVGDDQNLVHEEKDYPVHILGGFSQGTEQFLRNLEIRSNNVH